MNLGEPNATSVKFSPGVNIPVGSILFFPSWVTHEVEPQENLDRYTIAGNTFPEGSINLGGPPEYRKFLDIKLQ